MLSCSVTGSPVVTAVYWQKIINNADTNITVTTDPTKYRGLNLSHPSLKILDVDFSDAALYTCVAVNIVGEGGSAQIDLDISGSECCHGDVKAFTALL